MNVSMKWMLAVLLVGASGAVSAQETTYFYTGNPFTYAQSPYTTADSVSGSVTFAAPLGSSLGYYGLPVAAPPPVSFSFTDGVQTITSANAFSESFAFLTGPTGAIVGWDIKLAALTGGAINTSGTNNADDTGAFKLGSGDNLYDEGVWTEQTVQSPSAAPELDPASTASALTLLAGGLLLLRGRRATG